MYGFLIAKSAELAIDVVFIAVGATVVIAEVVVVAELEDVIHAVGDVEFESRRTKFQGIRSQHIRTYI